MVLLQYQVGMEIRQLRYLVALAEEQHFTKAAVRANVAQPALSRQIRNLEAELGVPLVDRTSRRVALTDAGERGASSTRSRPPAATR
jgi:DNA-binding transcriptional LysR family regulator